MDSRASLVVVAVASIMAGYLLSRLLDGAHATASLSEAKPVVYEELVARHNQPEHLDLEPYRPPVRRQPVPYIAPSVSYRYQPIPVVARLPVPEVTPVLMEVADEPEPELAEPQAGDLYREEPRDFVALLDSSGVEVDAGLNGLTPGSLSRLTWHAGESLYGSSVPTPVLVAQGAAPGPTLCLTAAVHGDELNGIEIVRRVMYSLDPGKLSGRVIGVPIVNLQGFERHSRYLADRRDLNRFFPGNPRGSSASRIAFSFFHRVIRHCDALVDLHTGSFHRTNLPQLRANLHDESVVDLTAGLGGLVILHSSGGPGTLRAAAVNAGIPAVTLEAGEPLRVDDKAVDVSVKALFTLMDTLEMYDRRSFWGNPEPTYYGSLWVRADKGGMLLGQVKLGKRVRQGDVLGTVTDPITNQTQQIVAPHSGRVIGMALNQFVMPGYAAFHIGVEADSVEELPATPDDPEIDHSVAAVNDLMDERDDSDE